ncbi:MAG: hypothetical protein ACOY3M_04370 [Patescibacteria group bacterium]
MENHSNHHVMKAAPISNPLKWAGICIALGAVILLAITVFKVPVNTIATGALFLACPLLHVLMMKNGDHKH